MTPEKQQAITFHLHEALRMMGPERTARNISGWTVAKSGGYFRAFKKVAGKLQGVYLGKDLNNAETKIKAKEQQMAG
jgi:hypothetical protein